MPICADFEPKDTVLWNMWMAVKLIPFDEKMAFLTIGP
jgi:hypothetical protein